MLKYPIFIGGRECGCLSAQKDGLMTVFSADCEDCGALVRLYLYGGGKSAYLGTLCPEGDRLRLVKKFSREGLKTLPSPIEYAADSEQKMPESDTLWYEGKNGILYCTNEKLVAVPASGKRLPREHIKRICGRDYMIFSAHDRDHIKGGSYYADDRHNNKKA